MKTLLIGTLTAFLAITAASAQTVVVPGATTTKTTTTYTSSNGVIDVYEPGTKFVLKETSGPVSYTYAPEVVYATPGGVVLTAEQIRTRVRAGLPVRVEYLPQGDTRVIHRVVIED